MDGEYELFERSDGALNWRGVVQGLECAWVTMWLLGDEAPNECFAIDWTAKKVALMRLPLRGAPRIFQIGYDAQNYARARLLWQRGYDVTSVCGNGAAMFVLRMRPTYELFVIDSAAAQSVRSEMTGWLQLHYPKAKIVALDRAQEDAVDPLRYSPGPQAGGRAAANA
jgi:hypothetical protein